VGSLLLPLTPHLRLKRFIYYLISLAHLQYNDITSYAGYCEISIFTRYIFNLIESLSPLIGTFYVSITRPLIILLCTQFHEIKKI
jgi:hypothetical protein